MPGWRGIPGPGRPGVGPKCALCGKVAGQHRKGRGASDCPGYVAPNHPETQVPSEDKQSGGASTKPKQRVPARPPRLGQSESKRAKQMLGLGISGLDNAAHYALPKLWPDEDRLKPEETLDLINATYNELEAVAPQVLVWLSQVAAESVHIAFLWTIALVAMPRLERRGIVPAGTTFLIALAPFQVGAGGASVGDRGNGNGQVDPASATAATVVVPDRHPDQSRQADGQGL